MSENKTAYAYIAIVAIVGIVAMSMLFMGGKTTTMPGVSGDNLAGESIHQLMDRADVGGSSSYPTCEPNWPDKCDGDCRWSVDESRWRCVPK